MRQCDRVRGQKIFSRSDCAGSSVRADAMLTVTNSVAHRVINGLAGHAVRPYRLEKLSKWESCLSFARRENWYVPGP